MIKENICIFIDAERKEKVDVTAISKESGMIFITLQEYDQEKITALIEKARPELQIACEVWEKPQEEETAQKPEKHFRVIQKAVEDMEEEARSFEESDQGKRFLKRLATARDRFDRYNNHGLKFSQLNYLANKHKDSFINASFDDYVLAFDMGVQYEKNRKRKSSRSTNTNRTLTGTV